MSKYTESKYTEDYSKMSNSELIMTYNAVMANAYPGDECAIEDEMEKRNLDENDFVLENIRG